MIEIKHGVYARVNTKCLFMFILLACTGDCSFGGPKYCMNKQYLEVRDGKAAEAKAGSEAAGPSREARVADIGDDQLTESQDLRTVTIHRLDTDPDEAWDQVMELLSETDGIDMVFNDDGTVTLKWEEREGSDDQVESQSEDMATYQVKGRM
ncbi:DUF1654 domain-containing protein [Pseudomonas aeruginosa]|nr:DUF1654 domain-containing protein [Pseudomonas aeruginosa]